VTTLPAHRRILALATAGAGGDLQPLMAAAIGMQQRGHRVSFMGDDAVARAVVPMGAACAPIPPNLDMGRIIGGVFRRLADLSLDEQGRVVADEVAQWSHGVGSLVSTLLHDEGADLLVTSLFGTGAADIAAAATAIPWVVVNSTFYVGPNPPRPLGDDFGPRAVPIVRSFLPMIDRASMVLHATDQVFDFDNAALPANHRYVGPLIWEPDGSSPRYLGEPGDPWVLVTLSTQLEDDVPLARAALEGLASLPVRVLVTTGGSHPIESLDPLPRNARAEEYVSHAAVLNRSCLVVSHAGHGSVMKAMWHGVPMVLVPWGRDQPGVAARAQRLGVAGVLVRDELRSDTLEAAARQVMDDPRYRDACRGHSERLRRTDPIAAAVAALESV
jgi:UDP:flavonoid glycosyltransferase YjiC (YdhE family)